MLRGSLITKYRNKTKAVSEGLSNVIKRRTEKISFELPEKYKGGRVEKWYLYWKNLLQDYRDVAVDTAKDVRLKPLKAFLIFSGIGAARYCSKNNPDEQSFRDHVVNSGHEVLLLDETVRNEAAAKHITQLETYYNQGLIRRFSFGIFSVMWIDNYNEKCSLFETRCTYLKPRYLTLHERVVDIGFLNRWWILEKNMVDFDINPKEWS